MTVNGIKKKWESNMSDEHKQGAEEIIGKMYEFARERLSNADMFTNSPKDKWKATGKRELLGDLFRYLKELKDYEN